jgi:nicotinic acid mononucleotide adenylyltransferase/predicted RNA-binding protein with PIN domain
VTGTPAQLRLGVYPGSFDPLTIAHLEIAQAARDAAELDRVDLALSREPLGKEPQHQVPLEDRVAAIGRAAATRPWLGVVVTEARLITDIARGYDVVVMGADKWAQVSDPAWYDDSADARDAALALLPRILVAPREGYDPGGVEILEVDPALATMSSTAARQGAHHLIVPEVRRRLIVDGNNLIGTKPDGWWRDREGATRRLVRSLQSLARRTGDRIAVVLDGRPLPDLPEGVHDGVLVAYAQRAGRNAADDRIVTEVAHDENPATLTVVTSDRALIARVRQLGANVERAQVFSRALESERR